MCDSSNRSAAYCEMELFKTAFKARPFFLHPPKAYMHNPVSSRLSSIVTLVPSLHSPFFLSPSSPSLALGYQINSGPVTLPKT